MKKEQLTKEQRRLRELLENEYEGIENYLIDNINSLEKFLETWKVKKLNEEAEIRKEETLEETISKLFRYLRAPVSIKGNKYTREAIILFIKNTDNEFIQITKFIYPAIAKKFNTTYASVERAIRHFVSKIDYSYIEECGYHINKHLTNSEFITIAAEIAKMLNKISKEEVVSKPKVRAIVIEDNNLVLNEQIEELLNTIAVPRNLKGYNFLREAIKIYAESIDKPRITKIYTDIGNQYDTTGTRVEKGIRHAIEVVFIRTDKNIIKDMFGYKLDQKPTNSEFIAVIASKLK